MLRAIVPALAVLSAAGLAIAPPIAQDPGYHAFHGGGGPWSMIVWSNLAFAIAGFAGFVHWLRAGWDGFDDRLAWLLVALSGPLIAAGSAWYHLQPSDASLVWDRLPMTLAFMPLLAAMLRPSWAVPLAVAGAGTVFFWQQTGDLRPYVMAQFFPMLAIPVQLLLKRLPYTGTARLWQMLGLYLLAKLAEYWDQGLLELSGISGHSWKHLIAAVALYLPLRMLVERRRLASQATG